MQFTFGQICSTDDADGNCFEVLELGGKTFKVLSSVRRDKDPNARLEKQRVKRSFIAIKFKNSEN